MDARQLLETVNAATGFIRGAGVDVLSVEPGVVSMRMPRKPELPPGRIAMEGEGPPAICAIATATLRAVDAPRVPGKN